MKGRDYVLREWRREKAFADLLAVLRSCFRRAAAIKSQERMSAARRIH